jgi:hypothetical protein
MKGITAIAAAALTGLALQGGAVARAAPLFGFNDSAEIFAHHAGDAADAGASIARVPVSWELVERTQGQFDWSSTDAATRALGRNGIRLLFVISAAPQWASPGCENVPTRTCPVAREAIPDYVAFGERLLGRYPGAKVQAWNEPNIEVFGAMSAARAAALTRALYRAAPGRVVGPAASPAATDDWRYVRRTYAAVPPDVPMSVHLYPREARPDLGLVRDWRHARRIADGRRIWVTEAGFAASQYGLEGQAAIAAGALTFLDRRGARAVIIHRLRDQNEFQSAFLGSLGVIDEHGVRKPAFHALRQTVRRLSGAP